MGWGLMAAYVAGTFRTTLMLALREPELAKDRVEVHAVAKR